MRTTNAFIRKTLIKIAIIVFLFSHFGRLYAQNDSICKVDKEYIKSYWTDFKGVVASPIHWSKGEYFAAGGVLATAGILYTQDKKIAEFFRAHQNDNLDKANDYFFEPFGKMYYTLPLMGAFYLYGALSQKSKPKAVAMDFVKASLYSGIIVSGIKHLAHRHRPFQTNPINPYLWDGPLTNDWNHTSFPSGHTIMTWTFASVVALHYKDKLWVPITVYTLATMEGIARMYADKHWSSDVLMGAALGYAIGAYVVNHSSCKWQISPVVGMNYSGLGITFGFGNPKTMRL